MISSADVARKALKLNDVAFSGRPYITAAFRFSYGNNDLITSPYTEYWRKMRKLVAHHLFSSQKVRLFRPIREDEVSRMIREIASKASPNKAIKVGEILLSFSCCLLCRVAFGKRFDEEGPKRFGKMLDDFVAFFFLTFLEDCFPLLGWVNKVSGVGNRIDNIFNELDCFYQELIDEHLSPNRPDSMNNDIIDILIQLKEDHSAPIKIDFNHIKALLMNIFIAGTDTNTVTITWSLTALMKNPMVMKKVQEEIRSLIGMKGFIDEDDIENLPYLKAVVKETMRLYPSIPFVPRETTEKCIINGYEIPQKTTVFVNVWAIGRDPACWENPDEFLPDRFLNTSISYNGLDLKFIPFGSGRRICPGMHQGVTTVELALANLLYSFDWKMPQGMTPDDMDTNASMGLSMHKKEALHLIPMEKYSSQPVA